MSPTPNSWRLAAPSAITIVGILAGVLAIHWAPDHPYWACNAIIAAALCDMLDGRVARLMGATSRFGAHLDSLADMVSFGVAPAVLIYSSCLAQPVTVDLWFLIPSVFIAAGAVRLARFDTLAEQGLTEGPGFVGMPIPVGALLLSCWVMLELELGVDPPVWVPLSLVLVSAAFMVSPWTFRDYKHLGSRVAQVAFYGAILGGLGLLFAGLPGGTVLFGCMLGYLLLSGVDGLRRMTRGQTE